MNLDHFHETIARLQTENASKTGELEMLRKDQEDLLELLSDQDSKLNAFKARLRQLGENVDDSASEGEADNAGVEP